MKYGKAKEHSKAVDIKNQTKKYDRAGADPLNRLIVFHKETTLQRSMRVAACT